MTDPVPNPPRGGKTGRVRLESVLLPAALGLLAFHLLRYGGELVDDAYISARYARNLADGHGLVFNPGERVEGYTNFLWTVLAAGAIRIGLPVIGCLQAVSTFLATLTAVLLARSGIRTADARPLVWLLPLPAFAYWGTTALETMAFTSLATLAFLAAAAETRDDRRRGSVVLFVLLGLTRPEGPLLFGLAHLGLLIAGHRSLGRLDLRRRLGDGLIFAILWGTWFLARWRWYGELLPNTFHAKVTGGEEQLLGGLRAVGSWALHHPVWTATLLIAPWLGWRSTRAAGQCSASDRERGRQLLAGSVVALGWAAYVLVVGGDFMPWWRFLVPITPLLALLTSMALRELSRPGLRPSSAAVGALWILHVVAPLPTDEPMRALVADRTTEVGLQVGAFFARELPDGALVALNTAGAVPWASNLPTLDMLGLTDREIARHPVYVVSPSWAGHRRGWGDYVLAKKPRAVLWYNSAGLDQPHYLGDRQLADSPRFRFFYQMRRDALATTTKGRWLGAFLGAPLGQGRSPELGLEVIAHEDFLAWTEVREADPVVRWFELRDDLAPLWPVWDRAADLEGFLDAARAHWRAERRPPGDPTVRIRVEELCDRALAALQAGRTDEARALLSEAAPLGRAVGSPRPFQYVTNLAVLDGTVPLAVQSQIEALRLDPDNALYLNNLRSLLTTPWEELVRTRSDG